MLETNLFSLKLIIWDLGSHLTTESISQSQLCNPLNRKLNQGKLPSSKERENLMCLRVMQVLERYAD